MTIKKLRSFIFVILGFLFLGLGIAGIVLPVIPGGPFLLIASYFFTKSSERFDRWFKSTIFYTKYVLAFKGQRGMTKKEKIRINLIADFFIILSCFYVNILFVQLLLILIGIYKHYYFITKIETITE